MKYFSILAGRAGRSDDKGNVLIQKLKNLTSTGIENIDLDTFSEKEKFFSFRRSKKMDEIDYGRCNFLTSLEGSPEYIFRF